jgi:peptide/nickel transport system permease protein
MNQTAEHPEAAAAPTTRPTRHWLARAMYDALGRMGARIGAGWVLVIAGFAVAAPLIANTHPFLMKHQVETTGADDSTELAWQITSPMLEHLAPIDVMLLVLFPVYVGLWAARRLSFATKFLTFTSVLVVLVPVAFIFVNPPETEDYTVYRKGLAAGTIEWAYTAPIPFSPTDREFENNDLERPGGPTARHWLGTDTDGADILSGMIHACRMALAIGFIAESLSLVIGVIVGGLMGYFAGWVDLIGLRLVEIFGSIPRLYLLLAIAAVFERNIYLFMVIIGITGWTGYAYFVRAEFLKLRKMDYVQAARASGLPLHSILFRHMLPNGMAPILVSAGFGVASAILYESTLSFLGLGIVDGASWGALLNQAVNEGGTFEWYLATFPGLAIFLTVFAFNLIGEAMRDAIDPHTQRTSHL